MPNRMRAKDIRGAVKRDDGVEYLKQKFGLSTSEEVYLVIRQVLPAEADSIISQMAKKHKRVKLRGAQTPPASPINVLLANSGIPQLKQIDEILQSMGNNIEWQMGRSFDIHLTSRAAKPEEKVTKEEGTDNVAKGGVAVMSFVLPEGIKLGSGDFDDKSAMSYEDVKTREQELATALREHEQKLNVCAADTSAKYHQMQCLQENIEKLKTEIMQLIPQYDAAWNDYCTSASATRCEESVNKFISEQLNETRALLLKLQKINVCVYADGKIEVENAEAPVIPDADLIMVFSKLVSTQAAGELTINELKGVAKLQIMMDDFRRSGREVDVAFESLNAQALWESIDK